MPMLTKDFSISAGGVLTFNIPPDYEMPRTLAPLLLTTTYNIVVVASDDAPGAVVIERTVRSETEQQGLLPTRLTRR